MKKAITCILIALFACSITIMGQKKALPGSSIKLNNRIDSISYALGQNLNSQQNLELHLKSLGIIQDTKDLEEELKEAQENASEAEMKELGKKLDKIKKENETNISNFLKGCDESLNSTDILQKSYNTGIVIGSQMNSVLDNFGDEILGEEKINKNILLQSLRASFAKEEDLIKDSEAFLRMAMTEEEVATDVKYADRIAKEAAYFEENLKKDGVTALPSGVQYEIIEAGTGAIPTENDQVEVHYEGRLIDGTVFDSSYKRGEPITLGLTQVIKGWTEVLKLMPEGSKWTVYIPYNMAYGDRDMGPIPACSNLIFDIELIKIEK